MFWSYVQLDDGTQVAYSETREDGTVRVAVERPVDFALTMRNASCLWSNGSTSKDLLLMTSIS